MLISAWRHAALRPGRRSRQRVVFGRVLVPEAQGLGLVLGDAADLGDLLEGLASCAGIVDVEVDAVPLLGHHAPFHQRLRLQARFDGEQAQAGRDFGVVAQLGGAHRGAPGAGRHDAALVAGEEDRVDQLRLAARELGDEGHHDLVGAHLAFEPAQPLLDGAIEQVVVLQPFGQQLQAQGELAPPGAVLVELLVEGSSHWSP
jgi:hypothetical protein